MPAPIPDARAEGPPAGGRRFALGAATFFGLASLAMTWPMAADLAAHYSSRQDFYLNLWILDWVARWLTEPGLSLFHSDAIYHPLGTSLASQDLTLVQTVAAAPLTLSFGPVVAFNALVLLSFWLAGFAAALWIRALTGDAAAGLLGGAVYAFAPYHVMYIPQLGMVAIGFLPLYLLADLSYARAPGPWRAARAGLALAVVGLGAWYYGVCAGLVALVLGAHRVWRAGAGRRARAAALEGVVASTCALALAPVVLQMLPAFLDRPDLAGGEERAGMGWLMSGFKGTPSTVALWSFLGLAPLALAVLGLRPLRRSRGPLLMAAGFLLLSLGESASLGGLHVPLPYAWLQPLPVLGALRYPDRFVLMTQLGLAALAGFGLVSLRRRLSWHPLALGALVLLPLLEFWPGPLVGVHPGRSVPVPPVSQTGAGAVLHVPTAFRNLDGEQMAWQASHGRPIVGGYLMRRDDAQVRALVAKPGISTLLGGDGRLPDDLARRLADVGVRYVCLQKRPWVRGADDPPATIALPFSLACRPLLRQRLFPTYGRHQRLPGMAAAWEPQLAARLGPEIADTELAAVYEVPGF